MGVRPESRLLRFQPDRRRLHQFRLPMPVRGRKSHELHARDGLVLHQRKRPHRVLDGRRIFLSLSRRKRRPRPLCGGNRSQKTGNRRFCPAGQRDGRFLSHPRRRRIFQERASGRGAQLRRVPPPPSSPTPSTACAVCIFSACVRPTRRNPARRLPGPQRRRLQTH